MRHRWKRSRLGHMAAWVAVLAFIYAVCLAIHRLITAAGGIVV